MKMQCIYVTLKLWFIRFWKIRLLSLIFFVLFLVERLSVGVVGTSEVPDSSNLLQIVWMAPFFSGGGYCSEAISFAMALDKMPNVRLGIVHHGDSHSGKFTSGLKSHTKNRLFAMSEIVQTFDPDRAIFICHSEPGAWNPPNYYTTLCPLSYDSNAITIGRTMFETDRLPSGWNMRLNKMDWIWVPTQFHRDVFISGGVEPQKNCCCP